MNVQNAPKKTVNTAPVAPLPLPTTNYHQTYRHSRANYLYELPLSTQARASCGASGASSRREQPRLVIGARGRVVVDDLQRKVSGHLVHVKLGDKVDQLASNFATPKKGKTVTVSVTVLLQYSHVRDGGVHKRSERGEPERVHRTFGTVRCRRSWQHRLPQTVKRTDR